MICWALITVYMLFAAVFITVKGIQNVEAAVRADGGKFTLSDVFTNSIFRNIVISLLSTYGLYLLSSIIFFDVAHLFTSFVQYMLVRSSLSGELCEIARTKRCCSKLAPSYINVIQTYSFCQINDLTWGNRPEEAKQDLGAAPVKDGAVDVALPTDEKDINAAYEDAMHVLQSPAPKEAKTIDTEQRMKDSYANIRTNVVMTWALSNGALVAVILSTRSVYLLTLLTPKVFEGSERSAEQRWSIFRSRWNERQNIGLHGIRVVFGRCFGSHQVHRIDAVYGHVALRT